MDELQINIAKIIQSKWPAAVRVLRAGKCPHCRRAMLWSFILPEWDVITWDGAYQMCGYWCEMCNWSNPGAREISQIDMMAHGGAGMEEP